MRHLDLEEGRPRWIRELRNEVPARIEELIGKGDLPLHLILRIRLAGSANIIRQAHAEGWRIMQSRLRRIRAFEESKVLLQHDMLRQLIGKGAAFFLSLDSRISQKIPTGTERRQNNQDQDNHRTAFAASLFRKSRSTHRG